MLGEKIYELRGKVQAQRILPSDAEGTRMEITFAGPLEGHGRLAAFRGHGTATYMAIARPDGIYCGEGEALIMSDSGEGFTATGTGLGRLAEGRFTYRGALTFRSNTPDLGWLNKVFGVFEYEQDTTTQEVLFTCYEWK